MNYDNSYPNSPGVRSYGSVEHVPVASATLVAETNRNFSRRAIKSLSETNLHLYFESGGIGGGDDDDDDIESGLTSTTVATGHLNTRNNNNHSWHGVDDPDAQNLQRALENSINDTFGVVVAVDVWIHHEDDGSFYHAEGGWYRRPNYVAEDALALARVEEPHHEDYVPPSRQIPGQGFAGYFWPLTSIHDVNCIWRDVKTITTDPYQPSYLRMHLLERAGLGKATGVPFSIRGLRGVVVYLAGAAASEDELGREVNEIHLKTHADVIGAQLASSFARRELKLAQQQGHIDRKRRNYRVKKKLSLIKDSSIDDVSSNEKEPLVQEKSRRFPGTYQQLKSKSLLYWKKIKGANLQPPPPMPLGQSIWSLVGSFLAMLILVTISDQISKETDNSYQIILGPFGAFLTLQYSLVPAPVSQPRNAIYGQLLSITIARLVTFVVPETLLSLRIPIALSLAICSMARLGIIHPPAGASAAIFAASSKLDGIHFMLMIFGNVVCIFVAVLINNLSDKRQYPTYYRFWPTN